MEKARALHRRLEPCAWLQAVGIGAPVGDGADAPRKLIVYCNRRLRAGERAKVPVTWGKCPVEIREIGRVLPASPGTHTGS